MVTDAETVELAMRIAALKMRLTNLYTEREAHHWLYNSQRILDGRCPVDMLDSPSGYLEVDNVVDQMLDCAYL